MTDWNLTGYPFDVHAPPPGWSGTTLRAIATELRSGFASGQHNKEGQGIPHLRPMNVSADGLLALSDLRYVDPQTDERRLSPSDVLFNNTNSPALVGKTALVRDGLELAFSNHMTRIRLNGARAVPSFVAYQLHALFRAGYFRQQCKKHVNQASINPTFLQDEVPILLPPLDEQRRIVAKLEALMARSRRAKESLDAIPPLLERFRQSVLAAAFRGDLTADWRAKNPDVEPADKLLARIRVERRRRWEEAELEKMRAKGKAPKDDRWKAKYVEPEARPADHLEEIPSTWCWADAAELCHEITVGHVGSMRDQYVDRGVPFLRSQNVRENRFDPTGLMFINDAFHVRLRKSALRAGDVVIVRSGAPGTACVVPDSLGTANCSDLVIARPVPSLDPHYMAFYLNSPAARARVLGAQVGVAQQHFNVGAMNSAPIALAPICEQAEIRRRLATALATAEAIARRVDAARARHASLDGATLASAFRGELVHPDQTG